MGVGWFIGWLFVGWLLVGCLLIVWLFVGCLVVWLFGCLVGWLFGCLVGWLFNFEVVGTKRLFLQPLVGVFRCWLSFFTHAFCLGAPCVSRVLFGVPGHK